MTIKDDIQTFRAIVAGQHNPTHEPNKKPALTESARGNPVPTKVPAYVGKAIPRYFNLTQYCAEHSKQLVEAKDYRAAATRQIARLIAEGNDLSAYIKSDAADYYAVLVRNIQRSMLNENKHLRAKRLHEGLPNHNTSWLVDATETVRQRCEAGEDCDEVINELAREYAQTEGGHHEAFEMARDALTKRAWEMDLGNAPAETEMEYGPVDDYDGEDISFGDVERVQSDIPNLQTYR